jgi:hypothetical protein
MSYEITFDAPGIADRTLNANRFVKIFASKLDQHFSDAAELTCQLQAFRLQSKEHLYIKWSDEHSRTFEYTFRCNGYGGGDYVTDFDGRFCIESGDTMTAGDMCEAWSYVDQIHQSIGELRGGKGEVVLKLLPSEYTGGEEPWPRCDYTDLSHEITRPHAFQMLAWWELEHSTDIHVMLVLGQLNNSTTLLRLRSALSWLDTTPLDDTGEPGVLKPLDVFAASWKGLYYCADFAGVYLGCVPKTAPMDPENYSTFIADHISQRYPGLLEQADQSLWALWEREPYCDIKSPISHASNEGPILKMYSAHSITPSTSAIILSASSRTLIL